MKIETAGVFLKIVNELHGLTCADCIARNIGFEETNTLVVGIAYQFENHVALAGISKHFYCDVNLDTGFINNTDAKRLAKFLLNNVVEPTTNK